VRCGAKKPAASRDAFLSNVDDSGERTFTDTEPVIGLRWQVAQGLNLFASLACGAEIPTLGGVAFQPGGDGGFDAALNVWISRRAEAAAKWRGTG